MPGTSAVLSVQIADYSRLTHIFGSEAINQGLADVGAGLSSLFTRLLAQHEVIGQHRQDLQGRWFVCFRVLSRELPRDVRETCAAIEVAGQKLMADLLISVFGGATGPRIPAVLAVSTMPSTMDLKDIKAGWIAWAEQVLATLPLPQKGPVNASAAEVESILSERSVQTVLQPIVRMSDQSVVGYEALSRGPQGSPLERPDALFGAAQAIRRTVEMELLCAELALERTRGLLPAGKFLTINLGPEALAQAATALPLAGRQKLIFELTEHLPLDRAEELRESAQQLRDLGIGVALDDIGCGFADIDTAKVLRPEIVKLCITVVRNTDKGSAFAGALRAATARFQELGCQVLAEGVETASQHAVLAECGIELAQGWFYGRPGSLEQVVGVAGKVC